MEQVYLIMLGMMSQLSEEEQDLINLAKYAVKEVSLEQLNKLIEIEQTELATIAFTIAFVEVAKEIGLDLG